MSINKIADMHVNKELNILNKGDTFDFSCDGCGKCCYDRNDIVLSPYDIYKACNHLEMSPVDFVKKYCYNYLGEHSLIPIVAIKFKEATIGGYTFCPFVKKREGKGRCIIHEVKPFVCGAFPLGRLSDNQSGEPKTQYFNQFDFEESPCGGKNETHTVEDWINLHNIADSEKASVMFNSLIMDLIGIIDLKNSKTVRNCQKVLSKCFMMLFSL